MVTGTTDGGTVVVEAFGSMVGTVDWTGIGETIGGSVVMPALAPGLPASSPSTNETVTGKAVVDVENFVLDDRFSGTLLFVDRFTTIVVVGTLPSLRVVEGVAARVFLTIVPLFTSVVFRLVVLTAVVFTVILLTAFTRNGCSGRTSDRLSTVPDAGRVAIARKTTTTVIAINIAINC